MLSTGWPEKSASDVTGWISAAVSALLGFIGLLRFLTLSMSHMPDYSAATPTDDASGPLSETALTLEELVYQARRNEAIARKLFDIEIDMLRATSLSGFVDRLTERVRDRFDLTEVWLVLTDIEDNQRIEAMLAEQGALSERLLFSTVDFLRLTDNPDQPRLVNNMDEMQPLVPVHLRRRVGSLALLPLELDGRLSGALVLGSGQADRYCPGMEAFFLAQLGIKTSAGLTSIWAREQLRHLATRDPLTGLPNRRELETTLDQELGRVNRYGQPMALLFIDLDDFKAVNDRWGHDAGDACLRHVAICLRELLRRDDRLFRFAGDEFIVLLPGQRHDDGDRIARRMQDALARQPLRLPEDDVVVRFSFGVSTIEPGTALTPDELIRKADRRLYQMKTSS
ncbi:diguanylate cyclase (GGDEF)-like protein [Tamilnaduibacter salinus]|nr:diguanylate cyclase (GGDEF)-like protein [Tamilnaduibacter salinus]